ncbi:MAG: PKD domain-containing protein [Pseudomonadota bacterium]|nr:PKD domain-containing protein [Pseudomonadota bacterium]
MVALLALLGCAGGPGTDTGAVVAVEPSAALGGEQVVFVGLPVTLASPESIGATFTWDFGDGATLEGATATHTYDAPGRYTLRLTAASTDGRTDTASATVIAVYEPLATPPTASGRLAHLDGTLYAALPDADEVVVVAVNVVVDRLAVCGHPVAVSAAAGVLAVACRDDAVQLWDTTSRTLVLEVPLRWGARPAGIAVDPDGSGASVTLAGTGEVVHVVDGGIETIAAVDDPRGIAVGDGALYAARFRSLDAAGAAVRVASDGVVTDFSFAPDLGPDSDTDARGVPTLLGAVAVRPDGRAIVVAGEKANVDRGLLRDGLALTHETSTRAALRSVDATTGAPLARALFDNRDRVGAVAFTPLGDKLLVAHLGAGVVDILDPFTLTRIGGFQSVGVGLDGLATDGETAWVLASIDRELVAYDLGGVNGEVELARVPLLDVEPLAADVLLGARVFHAAADPRMSTDAYVSCASCHPDGGADARTWDFTDRGEGLRETQALFAMPAAGPFHWSANFDEVQDFENAIRAHQAGTGFLSDADFAAVEDPLGAPKVGLSAELDGLAAYVRSFAAEVPRSPWRNADGAATEAGARGRALFVASGCETCHAGAESTDAAWNEDGTPLLHDVGTLLESSGERAGGPLLGLRTPSLRGLFATAPYLHDGRAATLPDALAAHGVALAPAEEADLVQYLLELEAEP